MKDYIYIYIYKEVYGSYLVINGGANVAVLLNSAHCQ